MAQYQIKGPGGAIYNVTAPDGATQEQVLQYVQQQHEAQQPQQKPQGQTWAQQHPDTASAIENAMSFNKGLNDSLFGIPTLLAGAAKSGVDLLSGHPTNPLTNAAQMSQANESFAEQKPWAYGGGLATGTVASQFTPVGEIGDVVRAGKGAGMLARTGAAAVNSGVRGALGGAVQGLSQTGTPSGALRGATVGGAGGAVLGPAVGTLAKPASKLFGSVSTKAARKLADIFGEDVGTLQRADAAYAAAHNGEHAPLAALTNWKQAGILRDIADSNPEIGAQMAALSDRPMAGLDQTALANARTQRMTQVMDLPSVTQPGATVRDTPIPLSKDDVDFLLHPQVKGVVGRDMAAPGEMPTPADKLELARQSTAAGSPVALDLTIDDLDHMRSQLSGEADKLGNINNSAHDRVMARRYSERAARVSDMIRNATDATGNPIPEGQLYGQAIDRYRADSQAMEGFKHGLTGKGVGETANPDIQKALTTPAGQQGYAAGRLKYNAEQRVAAGTPPRYSEQSGNAGAIAAATAASAAAHSGPALVYRAGQLLHGRFPASPAVQRQVAQWLTDPAKIPMAVNALRRAGVKEAQINNIVAAVRRGAAGVPASIQNQGQ